MGFPPPANLRNNLSPPPKKTKRLFYFLNFHARRHLLQLFSPSQGENKKGVHRRPPTSATICRHPKKMLKLKYLNL